MSRATIRNQFFLNDGAGNRVPIATGSWVTSAVCVDEARRLSLTVGITSATGAVGDVGGYTGTLLVQGTDELAQQYGITGYAEAGYQSRPGIPNGTGAARFWNTIPSGTFPVNQATQQFALSFTDVGFAFIRLAFNMSGTGAMPSSSGCGSGVWNVYMTAKNT